MKHTFTILTSTVLMLAAGAASPARANTSGAIPGFTGSPASGGFSCTICHDGPAGTGTVQILNAPLSYRPNRTYDLIVRVADPVQVGAGFQVSVEDPAGTHLGTLIASDPVNTQLIDPDWLTHTSDGVDAAIANWDALGQAAEFELQWKAPGADVGPVTFYAAGNAINDGSGNNGDFGYVTDHTSLFCPADTDDDGQVDVVDLVNVILDWGTDGTAAGGDVDGSGHVDVADLVEVILAWGACM